MALVFSSIWFQRVPDPLSLTDTQTYAWAPADMVAAQGPPKKIEVMPADDINATLASVQTRTISGATVLTASNFRPGDEVTLILAVSGLPGEPTWPTGSVKATLGSAWSNLATNYVTIRMLTPAPVYLITVTQV